MRQEVRDQLHGAIVMVHYSHIHNGIPQDCGGSALALAIEDFAYDEGKKIGSVEVESEIIKLWSTNRPPSEGPLELIVSKDVYVFISEFDEGEFIGIPFEKWQSRMLVIYHMKDVPKPYWCIDFIDRVTDYFERFKEFDEHFKNFEPANAMILDIPYAPSYE